jgi:hypothetical protein
MSDALEGLSERVLGFLTELWGLRRDQLQAETRLEEDLGMTGLDAAEFLESFAREFGVDLAGIEFHKHFGPECGPLLFCPGWLREEMEDLGLYPVTIGHLVNIAAAGRWFCPPRVGKETKWPSLPTSDLWDPELDGISAKGRGGRAGRG